MEVFEDDLRKGSFKFSDQDNNTSKEIPPYQVVFNVNKGLMTWCYPEPRFLVKAQIFPVPFVAVSDSSWDLCHEPEVRTVSP